MYFSHNLMCGVLCRLHISVGCYQKNYDDLKLIPVSQEKKQIYYFFLEHIEQPCCLWLMLVRYYRDYVFLVEPLIAHIATARLYSDSSKPPLRGDKRNVEALFETV